MFVNKVPKRPSNAIFAHQTGIGSSRFLMQKNIAQYFPRTKFKDENIYLLLNDFLK